MVMVISAELSMNFTVHIYIRNTFLTFRKKEKKRKNTWKDLTNCRFKNKKIKLYSRNIIHVMIPDTPNWDEHFRSERPSLEVYRGRSALHANDLRSAPWTQRPGRARALSAFAGISSFARFSLSCFLAYGNLESVSACTVNLVWKVLYSSITAMRVNMFWQ